MKPKIKDRKEILKIGVEISETEIRIIIIKKNWFFETIHKVRKLLPKRKERKHKVVISELNEVTSLQILQILKRPQGNIMNQFMPNFSNLRKMDRFLERHETMKTH